jgi:hypothetical protein
MVARIRRLAWEVIGATKGQVERVEYAAVLVSERSVIAVLVVGVTAFSMKIPLMA